MTRAVGLMSGTSLDGIDAALVAIGADGRPHLERFVTVPFDDSLRARLHAALPPNAASPATLAALDGELGAAFARAAVEAAAGATVDFVASHGLTAYHDGDARQTMQIGDPYVVRDALGASVVFDFRRADCAAGGNGAPLVPYVDALLFADATRDVVALNIGGIANATVLARGAAPSDARAWDTGPGTMLLDAFVLERTSGARRFDRDGILAASGRVDEGVVVQLTLREAFYLALPPPKSTGRERFGAQLLAAHAELFVDLSLEDGCATLCAFTAATIAESLAAYGPHGARTIASGGGARNPALVAALSRRLAPIGNEIVLSDALGVDADAKEALAFALLGYETLCGRPANVPRATGARRPVVLGAIAPHDLRALLARLPS